MGTPHSLSDGGRVSQSVSAEPETTRLSQKGESQQVFARVELMIGRLIRAKGRWDPGGDGALNLEVCSGDGSAGQRAT